MGLKHLIAPQLPRHRSNHCTCTAATQGLWKHHCRLPVSRTYIHMFRATTADTFLAQSTDPRVSKSLDAGIVSHYWSFFSWNKVPWKNAGTLSLKYILWNILVSTDWSYGSNKLCPDPYWIVLDGQCDAFRVFPWNITPVSTSTPGQLMGPELGGCGAMTKQDSDPHIVLRPGENR